MKCQHCNSVDALWEFKPVGVENPTISYICTSCLTDTHSRPTIKELKELVDQVSWAIDGPEQGVFPYSEWRKSTQYVMDWFEKYGQSCHGQWTYNS